MKQSEKLRIGGYLIGFFALAASLLVMTAFGGELKINVQSFPPGQDLRPGVAVLLSVDGLEEGQVATWHRVAVEGDVVLKLDRYHLFAGTAPGPRTFVVQVAAPGADPFSIASFAYGTEEDPVPNPTPTPEPNPGEQVWVLVVEESLNRTASETQVLLDATFRKYLTDHNIPYRRLDKDQTAPAGFVPWIKKAADLPHCFVVGAESGKAYYDGPLPKTAVAMLDLVKKYGGK